jgi:hypothetical protein
VLRDEAKPPPLNMTITHWHDKRLKQKDFKSL